MLKILVVLSLFLPFISGKALGNYSLISQDVENRWYIKSGYGFNYLTLPQDSEEVIEAETGIFATASAGCQFQKNIHSELEFAYRRNNGYAVVKETMVYPIDGAIHTYCGMANLMLDIPFQKMFVFSIGAGAGIQSTNGKLTYMNPQTPANSPNYHKFIDIKYRKEGTAVQGIVRVMSSFTDRFGVCIEYKYFTIESAIRHNSLSMNLKLDF